MLTLDCFGGVDCDLIVGGVAILDAQIIVVKVHVQIGEDQSVFDVLPNDTSHFIAIEFDDRAFYLNLGHSASYLADGMPQVIAHQCNVQRHDSTM